MRQLYQKFQTLTRARQIAVSVLLAHLLFLLVATGHHLFHGMKIMPRKIAVRSVSIAQAPTPQIVPVVKSAPVSKAVVAAKPAPVVKPVTTKKAISTSVAKKPPLQKVAPVAALPVEQPKVKTPLSVPVIAPFQPSVKQLYTEEVVKDQTYGEFLIGYLQGALELPELGDVKMKLEIDRFGRLIDCEILETRSVKNGEFLKIRLPELSFPCLNDFDILETAHTFTITFRNVENR